MAHDLRSFVRKLELPIFHCCGVIFTLRENTDLQNCDILHPVLEGVLLWKFAILTSLKNIVAKSQQSQMKFICRRLNHLSAASIKATHGENTADRLVIGEWFLENWEKKSRSLPTVFFKLITACCEYSSCDVVYPRISIERAISALNYFL